MKSGHRRFLKSEQESVGGIWLMRTETFQNASESFKAANPQIFGTNTTQKGNEQPIESAHGGASGAAGAGPAGPTKAELKSEKELQEQIVGFLERNNTIVIRSRMDRKTSTNVGTPDLLFALKGRAVAFEVKRPGEKPTKEQDKMMARMEKNGWLVFVIDNYDDAVQTINKVFLQFTIDSV